MQISVSLIGERIVLPMASCETVQGLIYRALSEDASYSRGLHELGRSFGGRKYKLFTFGELVGKYQIEDGCIVYYSGVRLEVRSAEAYFIQLLFVYFSRNECVRLGNNTVRVGDVRLGDRRIFDSAVRVRTLSPVTVYRTEENGHTVYYSPKDEEFYDGIIANARRKWMSYYGDDEGFSLDIYPCEDGRYVKRATHFKTTYITAWHGSFVLEGPAAVLDFLYNTGLGSKNSQGFGMFEVKM